MKESIQNALSWIRQDPLFGLFLSGLLIILGFSPVLLSRVETQPERSWPTVSGTITRSEVISSSCRVYQDTWVDCLIVDIGYSYFVDDKAYISEIGNADPELATRYPVGTVADVYYQPQNPSKATLQPKDNIPPPSESTKVIIAVVFAGPGFVILVISFSQIVRSWRESLR